MRPLLITICALTAFRVYAWSERLALVEVVLPLALFLSIKGLRSTRSSVRLLTSVGPLVALPTLVLYFGFAESVRSWQSTTYNGKMGFWEFAVGRLASYYYTALNNGAGLLATNSWPELKFRYVLGMLYTAPLGLGSIFRSVVDLRGSPLTDFLARYGDPEFNNPSGLYTVVFDLGIAGAVVYFALVGFLAGVLYRRFVAGSMLGGLLYPMFFISYLEIFRYPYLGSGRGFAWAVGICAILLISGRHKIKY